MNRKTSLLILLIVLACSLVAYFFYGVLGESGKRLAPNGDDSKIEDMNSIDKNSGEETRVATTEPTNSDKAATSGVDVKDTDPTPATNQPSGVVLPKPAQKPVVSDTIPTKQPVTEEVVPINIKIKDGETKVVDDLKITVGVTGHRVMNTGGDKLFAGLSFSTPRVKKEEMTITFPFNDLADRIIIFDDYKVEVVEIVWEGEVELLVTRQ